MSSFINDSRGISEEFTSLPAMVVVMIGFALFFALIAGVYHSHTEKMERVDSYRTANLVLEKIAMEDGSLVRAGVMRESGVVDNDTFHRLTADSQRIRGLVQGSDVVAVDFGLRLRHEKLCHPMKTPNIPMDMDRVAASMEVPVYLNAAETVPGELTIIVWEA